jgi:hypothetical protein
MIALDLLSKHARFQLDAAAASGLHEMARLSAPKGLHRSASSHMHVLQTCSAELICKCWEALLPTPTVLPVPTVFATVHMCSLLKYFLLTKCLLSLSIHDLSLHLPCCLVPCPANWPPALLTGPLPCSLVPCLAHWSPALLTGPLPCSLSPALLTGACFADWSPALLTGPLPCSLVPALQAAAPAQSGNLCEATQLSARAGMSDATVE